MTAVTRLYLDTNIFIALAEGVSDVSAALWDFVSDPPPTIRLCTSELTLAELVVKPYRDKAEDLLRIYDSWLVSGDLFEVLPVDKPVLWGAAIIRAQHPRIKLPDAIHLATATRMGCKHILTEDAGIPETLDIWNRQGGIEVGPYRLTRMGFDLTTINSLSGARPAQ